MARRQDPKSSKISAWTSCPRFWDPRPWYLYIFVVVWKLKMLPPKNTSSIHLLGLTYEAKTEQKEVDSMSIFWGRYSLISPKTFRNGNWRQRDALDDALMVTTTSHQVRWRCNALPQDMLICNETTTPNKWSKMIQFHLHHGRKRYV